MRPLVAAVLAAVLCRPAAAAGYPLEFADLVGRVMADRLSTLPSPMVPPFAPDPNCRSLPHVYERSGILYKNGTEVARYPRSWAASCSGALAWQDSSGYLYKDGQRLGSDSASEYRITRYSGHVIWQASWGFYRDGDKLADRSPQSYLWSDWTGDVAWTDSYRRLYRNAERLSPDSTSPQTYAVAAYTGDVVWHDSFGYLYKNETKLDKAERYAVAPTGDVVWEGFIRGLYKNGVKVTDFFQRWDLRDDGRLIWWDSSGYEHSA